MHLGIFDRHRVIDHTIALLCFALALLLGGLTLHTINEMDPRALLSQMFLDRLVKIGA